MRNKKLISTIGLTFVLATVFFLANQGTSSAADDCRIVRIISRANQDVSVDPKNIVVDKGTCVIWFNKASKRDPKIRSSIEILFEEGKKVCEDVVEASMDFKLDENNCFITVTHVPPFGTASLMFDKEGTYEYVVKIKGELTKTKGQVTVK